MNNHFLIDKIVVYEKKELKDPDDSIYDEELGMWLWGEHKEVLVISDNPKCPKRGTKKNDIETGEDLKGE